MGNYRNCNSLKNLRTIVEIDCVSFEKNRILDNIYQVVKNKILVKKLKDSTRQEIA